MSKQIHMHELYIHISTTTYYKTTQRRRRRRRRRRQRPCRHHAGIESTSNGMWDYGYTNRSILDGMSLRYTKELVGGPRQKPQCLPPPLTTDLSLENITELWRNENDRNVNLWRTYEECIDQDLVTASDNDAYRNDDDD